MARKKINPKEKKQHISLVVSPQNFTRLNELNLNKSKFINWLLEEHFNELKKGGRDA